MRKIEKETIKLMNEVSKQLFGFGVRDVELAINKKDFIKLKEELSHGAPNVVLILSDDGIMFRIKSF